MTRLSQKQASAYYTPERVITEIVTDRIPREKSKRSASTEGKEKGQESRGGYPSWCRTRVHTMAVEQQDPYRPQEPKECIQ